MSLAIAPEEWTERALCAEVGGDEWYPEGMGSKSAAAKSVCRRCDVRADCLRYALDNEEQYGIWAGYTDRELRRIRMDDVERADIFAGLGAA